MSAGKWIKTVVSSGLIAAVLAGGGCQSVRRVEAPAPAAEPGQPGVAGTETISLFGELSGHDSIPYVARAARSVQQHTFTREGRDFDPDIDSTGRLMVFASTRHAEKPDIYLKAVTGSTVTQLTADPASDVQPRFSPDGSRIAFASDRAGNWDIWVVDTDGRNLVQVTRSQAQEIHPSWSPDGRMLVYCACRGPSKPWELWIVDAARAGTRKFIGYGLFPEWSPDGGKILFQRARRRGNHWFSIWTIELADGEARRPTEIISSADQALVSPSWSPDGSRVVFCSVLPTAGLVQAGRPMPSRADIWVVDADGKGRVRLTDGTGANFSPRWSPDGRIFFTSDRDGQETIWSLRPLGPAALSRAGGSAAASDGQTQ